mgnify:CR=1 FL=1
MSTNISREKREQLLQKLEDLKKYILLREDSEAADAYLPTLNEAQNAIRARRYELVYEEHREAADDRLLSHLPVLTEEKALAVRREGTMNFLLEGDNLDALQILQKTHRGRVDVVYIDPPYNTGNQDFLYDDRYVGEDDQFRHSKWLSFMQRRLELIKPLMSAAGVLFISIDDHEVCQLKLILDKLFGENNFIGLLPRVTKRSGKDHSLAVAKNHDYILAYARSAEHARFKGLAVSPAAYPLQDEYAAQRGGYKLNQTLDYDTLWYNPKMDFPLTVDGETFYPGGDAAAYERRQRGEHKEKDWVWRWSQEKFDFGLANGFVVVKKGRGRRRIYTKTYANASIEKAGNGYTVQITDRESLLSSLAFTDNAFSNDNAKKEIAKVGLDRFGFPKPTSLVRQLISLVDNAQVVLDCFAGSGTTGQAVMQLNAEDGGHRRFILCTNNENGICREITYERIRRVIETENYAASLRYFRVEHLPVENRLYDEYAFELLHHIEPLTALERQKSLADEEKIGIAPDDQALEELLADKKRLSKLRALYLGGYILLSQEQQELLTRHGIRVRFVPDTYYDAFSL